MGKQTEKPEDADALLKAVQTLFASLSDYGDGADARVAFVQKAMRGYCLNCGSRTDAHGCNCMREE